MICVKLTRQERKTLLRVGRKAGDIDSASEAMAGVLFDDVRFEHLAATVISDYAWAAARFCFPADARW